jgi:hypothetical protein
VPDFEDVRKNNAEGLWVGQGFTGAITFMNGTGNYRIHYQSLAASSSQPCTAAITLGP